MKAEILAVGTELLMGQIVNSNAAALSRKLADIGVDVYYHSVVGDNPVRLREAFRLAAGRAELVICTGGLGPTEDDLTKDILAEWTGRELITDEPAYQALAAYFEKRGAVMVPSNVKQAMTLRGAQILPNDTGLAIGAALTHQGVHYVLLPGPPREMAPMFDRYAVPWILAQMQEANPLHSAMLKFAGIGESNLEHALLDLIHGQTDPTLATYAKEGEVTLRVTTRAPDRAAAERTLRPVVDHIRSLVGRHLFAEEEITLEEAVVRKFASLGLTLATAESCTGGLLGERLTSVPGSSAIYRGGLITYANEWKRDALGVPSDLLEGPDAPGAVSAETAEAMVRGLLQRSDADVAAAVTGVAGPAHSERKPIGLVFGAYARRGGPVRVEQWQFAGDREGIRIRTVKSMLFRLWELLGE